MEDRSAGAGRCLSRKPVFAGESMTREDNTGHEGHARMCPDCVRLFGALSAYCRGLLLDVREGLEDLRQRGFEVVDEAIHAKEFEDR